jgi:hypothetical protein
MCDTTAFKCEDPANGYTRVSTRDQDLTGQVEVFPMLFREGAADSRTLEAGFARPGEPARA